MARYAYQHTIDLDADKTLDDDARAILKAAFAVAERAHFGQNRLKAEPEWQYICHPIMVYDIMRKLGENDPIVLAAAILHDSIEDCSEFRADPEQMCHELIMCLYYEGMYSTADDKPPHNGIAHEIADEIHWLCHEVTNPKIMDGDGIKENYQHDRIVGMSFAAKRIKIADQAASLICNLTMPNNPEKFTPQQELAFTEKAHTLGVGIVESVQATAEEREALKPYASFFGKVMLNVWPLVESHDAAQKAEIREGFDFDRLFTAEHEVTILHPKSDAVGRLPLANDIRKTGLTWVDYDAKGKVIGYGVWTAWDKPEEEANAIQKKLTSGIRAMRLMARDGGQYEPDGGVPHRILVMPKGLDNIEDHQGERLKGIERVFEVSPPLEAMAFAAAAKDAGAVDGKGWLDIREFSAEIKSLLTAKPEKTQNRHPRIKGGAGFSIYD